MGAFIGSHIDSFTTLPRAMDLARTIIDDTENSGRSLENGRIILARKLTGSRGRFAQMLARASRWSLGLYYPCEYVAAPVPP